MEVDKPIETATTEIDYPESLFDDEPTVEDTPIETEETTQEETTEPTVEDKGTVEEKPQMLKLKYNGEEKEVTLEEAIALAQKGMNYDKKLQELDNLKNSRQIQLIDRLAKESGMSVEDYLNNVEQQFEQQTIAKIGNDLRKKYPNADKDTLNELAKSQYALMKQEKEKEKLIESQNKQMQQEDIEKQNDELLTQMINDFSAKYPDVNLEEALKDTELVELIEKGESLVTAYTMLENKRLKAQLDAEKLNNKNKLKSTGSITGEAKATENDAFRSGFWD